MSEQKDIDNTTCWYDKDNVVKEMNRFYDKHYKDMDVQKHIYTFIKLLEATDEKGETLIDLGTGTGWVSEFCKDFKFHGADLPHILSGSTMRNYPKYFYRACDITKDDLSWINTYTIVTANAVIDVMQNPLEVLENIIKHCKKWLLIHRQEITEEGQTRVIKKDSYGGQTYHSIINRNDFNEILERYGFYVVKELSPGHADWENGGSSFLIRKKKSWALNNMDVRLDQIFCRKTNGFFIEAGANDGLAQSNTMYLEFYRNWKGILIEPIPEIYRKCKENRSTQTMCLNYALSDEDGNEVEIGWATESNGLLGFINEGEVKERKKKMKNAGEEVIYTTAKTQTLNTLLHNITFEQKIDLLVLDLEGYEMPALRGLDLSKWKIEYILVEELQENSDVRDYLSQYYEFYEKLSEHDYLYKIK